MNKKILIIGVLGQDGKFLSNYLKTSKYMIYGVTSKYSDLDITMDDSIKIYEINLLEFKKMEELILKIQPDEIYNLAAQSSVALSWNEPVETFNINTLAVLNILEIIRKNNLKTKFLNAASSEIFGISEDVPQTEKTIYNPITPYGVSKLSAYLLIQQYRKVYGMHCSNVILYSHESEIRPESFVTRKISKSVAEIKLGLREVLELGNLDAKRDWGYAGDYVEGMYLIMQQEIADDYILATNHPRTVKEFVEEAFKVVEIEIEWKGTEEKQIGINKKTGEILVKVNPEFYRPLDNSLSVGNPEKMEKLGWKRKVTFKELVKKMVDNDLKLLSKEIKR